MPNRAAGAVLLAALCLLGGYAARSSLQHQRAQAGHTDRQQEAGGGAADQQPTEAFWERTEHDPAVFFTAALAFLTTVLAGVSVVQAVYIVRADRTSRMAADAAKISADASTRALENLARTERAVLAVRINDNNLVDAVASGKWADSRGAAYANPIAINYAVKNYGKTPAFIDNVSHGLARDEFYICPEIAMTQSSLSVATLAAGEETHLLQPELKLRLSSFEAEAIGRSQSAVWLVVVATFRDTFGARWESKNVWRYAGSPGLLWNFSTEQRQIEHR